MGPQMIRADTELSGIRTLGASLEKDLGTLQSNSNQVTVPLVPYPDTHLCPGFLAHPSKHAKRRRIRRTRHPRISTNHLRNSTHLNSVFCMRRFQTGKTTLLAGITACDTTAMLARFGTGTWLELAAGPPTMTASIVSPLSMIPSVAAGVRIRL